MRIVKQSALLIQSSACPCATKACQEGEKDRGTNTRTELENVIDGRAEWYSEY
jgi:hypothetical protein